MIIIKLFNINYFLLRSHPLTHQFLALLVVPATQLPESGISYFPQVISHHHAWTALVRKLYS